MEHGSESAGTESTTAHVLPAYRSRASNGVCTAAFHDWLKSDEDTFRKETVFIGYTVLPQKNGGGRLEYRNCKHCDPDRVATLALRLP